ALDKVVDFGANQVFNATTYTCLLFLTKSIRPNFLYTVSQANEKALTGSQFAEHAITTLTPTPWVFGSTGANSILEKITQCSVRLLDLPVEISRGSSTGDDDVFMVDSTGTNIESEVL